MTGFEGAAAGAGASATGAGASTVTAEVAPFMLGSPIFLAQALKAKTSIAKAKERFIRPTFPKIKKYYLYYRSALKRNEGINCEGIFTIQFSLEWYGFTSGGELTLSTQSKAVPRVPRVP